MSTLLTIADDALREPLRTAGLGSYDDFLRCALGEIVHQSTTTLTRRIELHQDDFPYTLYLKTYHPDAPGPLHGWICSRPIREIRNYHILRDWCAISVPDVIAFGSRRSFGRWRDGFIVTRAVPNAVSLDRVPECTGPLRRYLLDQTAAIVSRMHAAGFYHIDLQWRNLLVSDDGTDAPEVYVIDSARGGPRRWRILREHGRLRDLSSLSKEARHRLTTHEQLRWLRSYLAVRRFTPSHRALIRTIRYDRAIKDHEA